MPSPRRALKSSFAASPRGLGVFVVLGADGRGPLAQVLNFRHPHQERLPAGLGVAPGSVDADVEGFLHRSQHFVADAILAFERRNHLALDDVAGPDGRRAARDVVDGEFVLGGAPVTLEALGRDPGPDGPAKGHPLGQPAVVPVQQCRRVGVQGVDLQEP